ncbi:MAG: circadian clock protein KaiC [Syntrophothermus sp.]
MKKNSSVAEQTLPKVLTGIKGLDEITYGGLPKGRPTLVAGAAGSGKTLLAMEFIVRGAQDYNEPGVFVSFEESPEELKANVKSLGFDVDKLIQKKLMDVDYIHVERSEIEVTGEFDLEGLFIRLGYIIDSIGAKRIALDTIESLFSGIDNHAILRSELRRLFRWLKDKGVTAVITGEQGEKSLTRQGLEEYVSDCVIFLDHRIKEQYGTRRLRIVKYRGSLHGTNEYPFLINKTGLSVIPITSVELSHEVSNEIISTGVETLDEMFKPKGIYRGTTILISGNAGVGKTSLLASFINNTCSKGEKCLYVALEESENQIIRNMNSIGINLQQWVNKGNLQFHITRPTYHSLEMHLALIYQFVEKFKPSAVVIDPISNLTEVASSLEANSLLTRLIDFLKTHKITTMLSNLTSGSDSSDFEDTEIGISSIVDTWLLLRAKESNGERNRTIYILKSRGMKHSNQVREFLLTDNGVKLVEVFVGKDGILVGSARRAQQRVDELRDKQIEEDKINLEKKLKRLKNLKDNQMTALQSDFEKEEEEIKRKFEESLTTEQILNTSLKEDADRRQEISKSKTQETSGAKRNNRKK